MRNFTKATALAASLVVFAPLAYAQGPAELDRLRDRYVEATNANDAAAVAQLHAENARVLHPGGDALEGRQAIEAHFAERFEMSSPANFAIQSMETRELGGAHLDLGTYSMDATIPGGQVLAVTGNYVALVEESEGEWLITLQIFNENVPAPR
jgi:uncharacterized protein (TIGR02246 family)